MVEGKGPSLLVCDWLQVVRLDWQALGITHVSTKPASLESLLQKHSQLFGTDLGTMKDLMATIAVQLDTKPCYSHPRPVPYALKGAH